MTVTIVAAVAANRVIGRDGALPWHLPEDLRRFRELTMGHVVVMGRRTYDSIGHALPGRHTVVVTRRDDWHPDGVVTAPSLDVALAVGRELCGEASAELFVVGGAELYRPAILLADRMVLTLVDDEPAGDTMFPEIDWSRWRETSRESRQGFAFVEYARAR